MTTVGYVKLENKEVEFTAFFRIIIVIISKQDADRLESFRITNFLVKILRMLGVRNIYKAIL